MDSTTDNQTSECQCNKKLRPVSSSAQEINDILTRMQTHANRLALVNNELADLCKQVVDKWNAGVFDNVGFYQLATTWPEGSEAIKDCFDDMVSFLAAGRKELERMNAMYDALIAERGKYELDR